MNNKASPIVGILGGQGKMGAWFARFFTERGWTVVVADLATDISAAELIARSDIVVVSLPIGETCRILTPLLPLFRQEQLVMDLTSVKSEVAPLLMQSAAEICSIHPMFGPQADSLQGQTIVTCKLRPGRWTSSVLDLFSAAGAALHEATPAEHDQMMAIVQGLNHFSAIAMGHSLIASNFDVEQSFAFMSPIYRIRMDMVGRILAQDPRLYAEIAILNSAAPAVIQNYIDSAQKLLELIKQRDIQGFMRYFSEAAAHLGSFKEAAMAESDELVKAVCEQGKK